MGGKLGEIHRFFAKKHQNRLKLLKKRNSEFHLPIFSPSKFRYN
jgi:hypothetical protein